MNIVNEQVTHYKWHEPHTASLTALDTLYQDKLILQQVEQLMCVFSCTALGSRNHSVQQALPFKYELPGLYPFTVCIETSVGLSLGIKHSTILLQMTALLLNYAQQLRNLQTLQVKPEADNNTNEKHEYLSSLGIGKVSAQILSRFCIALHIKSAFKTAVSKAWVSGRIQTNLPRYMTDVCLSTCMT